VTDEEIATFWRDGVVLLKGMFDADWLKAMYDGFETAIHNLGSLGRNMVTPEQTGAYYMDLGLWMRHAFFRRLAIDSPAPAIAAQVLKSKKAWLYDDQLFVKEPGTSAPTIFHQDAGYFRCHGNQICAMWLTADHVDPSSGSLGYVRSSHLWNQVYKPRPFSKTNADLYKSVKNEDGLGDMPPIDEHPEKYDIVYFNYEPGDCSIHHVRTIHGAAGNSSTTRRRRAISVRYCGDDVVYAPRPYAPKQPHIDVDLPAGAPIGCDVHPLVWPRATSSRASGTTSAALGGSL
jgi:ectoine hydroxylase-related dioxygenase (phytanoyl-CoA dioxygenase family)